MLKTIVTTFQTVVMGSSLSQQSAIDTIYQWRSKPSHELIFDSGRREISQYMQAVDRLQQSPSVKGFNELMSTATARLRLEFLTVLSRQADHHQPGPISTTEWSSVNDSTAYVIRFEDYVGYEPPSKDVITYLQNIAERMNKSGKLVECVKAYKSVRKAFIQSQLKPLRFEELKINGGYGSSTRRCVWDELKVKINLWVEASKICFKILFEKEKNLCREIFEGFGDNKDECFVGTVQDFAVGLFCFAEAVSLGNHPYAKMETILALYDAFFTVLPNVDALFSSEQGKGITNGCSETLSRIENDVVRMLHDFENDVFRDISNASDDDRGDVHQLTKNVVEQISVIVKNKNLLTSLIKSSPSLNFGDLVVSREDFGDYFDSHTFLELHLILIIVVLQKNLEGKSKCYKDPSFAHLFMMNNVRYIVQKVEESNDLRELIGDSYTKKLNENVELAKASYEATICDKFLNCFEDDGLYVNRCFRPRVSKSAFKKRLKVFNAVFEEFRIMHSFWTIQDSRLRDEVRFSMCEKLVPAYKQFLEKFSSNPEIQLLQEKNVKYSAEDLEALVLENISANAEVVV